MIPSQENENDLNDFRLLEKVLMRQAMKKDT